MNPAAASGKTLVESWDGSAWSVVTSSNEGFSGLSAVSCLPLGPCTAVGAHSSGRNGGTLVEASQQTIGVPRQPLIGFGKSRRVCVRSTDVASGARALHSEPATGCFRGGLWW